MANSSATSPGLSYCWLTAFNARPDRLKDVSFENVINNFIGKFFVTKTMKEEFKNSTHVGTMADLSGAEIAAIEVETLRREIAGQRDSHLRLTADFDNFKRRSRLEIEVRAIAQKESFIVELLPVIDNLERALASGALRDFAEFYQGVEMTFQQLQQLLRQHGVESETIIGTLFDQQRQEAISQGHDPAQPDQAILAVVQRGYRRSEKIVRPAKVVVNNLASFEPRDHGR